MHYLVVPAAKEILFSTSILFSHFFILRQHFQGRKKIICYIPGFLEHLGTRTICKVARLFYRSSISLIFVCTSSKLSKTSTFNLNITTTCWSATFSELRWLSG